MTSPYTPEAMRKRFWELSRQRADIHAKSKPLRDERDKLLEQQRPLIEQEKALIKQYKDIEKDLPAVDTELSALARALGNKVGQPV